MEGMPRTARVVTWNGRDVPAELRELPAGRYVVEAITYLIERNLTAADCGRDSDERRLLHSC